MAPVTRAAVVLAVAGAGLVTVVAAAQSDPTPTSAPAGDGDPASASSTDHAPSADVRTRIERLLEREGAREVAGAVVRHARRALDRATHARNEERADTARRAEAIARAALTLAERRVALHAERRALQAGRQRASEARAHAARARQALETQLAQRRRVRRQAHDAGTDAGVPFRPIAPPNVKRVTGPRDAAIAMPPARVDAGAGNERQHEEAEDSPDDS